MIPKVGGIIAAAIGIAILIGYFSINFEERKTDDVFHVTLADPTMYENGVFTNFFEIEEGSYHFSFVPSGDSPRTITISLQGPNYYSKEKFVLNADFHDTGISEYYTWSYIGDEESTIEIPSSQEIQITIDPHENYNGPVSITLEKMS